MCKSTPTPTPTPLYSYSQLLLLFSMSLGSFLGSKCDRLDGIVGSAAALTLMGLLREHSRDEGQGLLHDL